MGSKSGGSRSEEIRQQPALVFELEYIAFPGRRMLYGILARVLKEKEIDLTPIIFSRYCLGVPLQQSLSKLGATADRKKTQIDKLAEEIQDKFQRALVNEKLKLNATLNAVLNDAKKGNLPLGALTFLPKETAQPVMEKLGLAEFVKLCVLGDSAYGTSGTDVWGKLARLMELPPRQCLMLTSSAEGCIAAQAAGAHCVAIPDEFTAFQDFGGADLIVEDGKLPDLKTLLPLTCMCRFR